MQEFIALVRGAYFRIKENPEIEEIILAITSDEAVTLQRDPNNRHDPNAIIVLIGEQHNIGFVGKEWAADIAPLLDEGFDYTAKVSHFNGPIAPVIEIEVDDGQHKLDLPPIGGAVEPDDDEIPF